ncbi:peptidase inhibitor family I36 protein [Streptomyces sp. DH37]|uniref:peptidase inhibitor family I36 protein n=1 Tax=Streptomyces sp. DH37 TaxID=3040122 RepID=UPI0024423950|nr:peptidase inhibitor family I36 protein [Streptomyces sp. DH37]MDG9703868.1 peptidase inhibitor family I36 protein [Streptomyces sp. DH37]
MPKTTIHEGESLRTNRRSLRTAAVAVTAIASLAGITQAQASEAPGADDPAAPTGTLQESIDEVLASTEGGTQISPYEISWEGGAVIMSFPRPGEAKAPTSSPTARKLQAKLAGKPQMGPLVAEWVAGDHEGCPTEVFGNDWYCFYQYENYGGRRLQWNATHEKPVYFSKYDFVNKTSSWVNGGGKTIVVYGRTRSGDDSSCTDYLWSESQHMKNRYVGGVVDNRADCFTAKG